MSPARKNDDREEGSSSQGCLGRVFSLLFSPLRTWILIASGVILVVVLLSGISLVSDPLDAVLNKLGFEQDSKPEIVDSTTIVLGIREMAILQTQTADILIDKDVRDKGTVPDAELRVNYIGYATAGIDLSLITEESIVTNEDGSLIVTLPPAQITGCYLGKPDVVHRSCVEVTLVQDCGKIVDRMLDESYDRAIDELYETALEFNLLDEAYREAQARIYDLLQSLGHEQISFDQSAAVLPASETCFSN